MVRHVGHAYAGSRHTPTGTSVQAAAAPGPITLGAQAPAVEDQRLQDAGAVVRAGDVASRPPARAGEDVSDVRVRGASARSGRARREQSLSPVREDVGVTPDAPRATETLSGRQTDTRSLAQASGPRPDETTRASRPWKHADSQVLRPERKDPARGTGHPRSPWSAPGDARSDSLRSNVATAVTRTTRERRAVRRASIGMTRISRLRARGRHTSTGHTLDARRRA
jgi:hypothetical protein